MTTGTNIKTPYPIQTSIISTSEEYCKVAVDESCVDIGNEDGISVTSFYD